MTRTHLPGLPDGWTYTIEAHAAGEQVRIVPDGDGYLAQFDSLGDHLSYDTLADALKGSVDRLRRIDVAARRLREAHDAYIALTGKQGDTADG